MLQFQFGQNAKFSCCSLHWLVSGFIRFPLFCSRFDFLQVLWLQHVMWHIGCALIPQQPHSCSRVHASFVVPHFRHFSGNEFVAVHLLAFMALPRYAPRAFTVRFAPHFSALLRLVSECGRHFRVRR